MPIKKLLLLSTLVANTALADTGSFYIKPMLGSFQSEKIIGMTSKRILVPGIAVGYNLREDVRVDFSFEHFSNIKHTLILRNSCSESSNSRLFNEDRVCTYAKISTGKVNLFVDLLKVKNNSMYVGIGAGLSHGKGVVTHGQDSMKVKASTDFAYSLHAGVAHKVLNNTTVELGYSYKHLSENIYNYKGHNMVTAVRIDL